MVSCVQAFRTALNRLRFGMLLEDTKSSNTNQNGSRNIDVKKLMEGVLRINQESSHLENVYSRELERVTMQTAGLRLGSAVQFTAE